MDIAEINARINQSFMDFFFVAGWLAGWLKCHCTITYALLLVWTGPIQFIGWMFFCSIVALQMVSDWVGTGLGYVVQRPYSKIAHKLAVTISIRKNCDASADESTPCAF